MADLLPSCNSEKFHAKEDNELKLPADGLFTLAPESVTPPSAALQAPQRLVERYLALAGTRGDSKQKIAFSGLENGVGRLCPFLDAKQPIRRHGLDTDCRTLLF